MTTITELYYAAPARYPELSGKVAIITGSSRGIGAGIAARLAKEGMRVVITGLDAAETETATADLRQAGAQVSAVPGDLSNDTLLDALFEHTLTTYGQLDLLVNNAADLRRFRARDVDRSVVDAQLAVNLRAPLMLSLQAASVMGNGGSIINISSVGGARPHLPGIPYDVAKGALDALTRTLAVDLGEFGIRVNGVAPGFTPVATPDKADYLREMSKYIPMRTPGRYADIAATVAFLASPDASYITGQTIYVDGGLSTQLHPPEHPI